MEKWSGQREEQERSVWRTGAVSMENWSGQCGNTDTMDSIRTCTQCTYKMSTVGTANRQCARNEITDQKQCKSG